MSAGYRGKRLFQKRETARTAAAACLLVLAALVLGALVYQQRQGPAQSQGAASGAGEELPAQPDRSVQPPAVSALAPAADPEPEPYDFSQPAPEGEAVDNRYFDDAAFVGDSRTDGFMTYSGIGTGKNLTSNGLSIFRLDEKKALTINGEKYTLLEALALERYGKVYLSLGVNELGYHNDQGFYNSYCEAIDYVRQVQPEAVIYIQGLIPLNEAQIMASSGHDYLTNEHLRVYNDLMRQAAQDKQVVFLDLYSEFVDENGELPQEASRDGVHLGKEYCQRWLAYLKTHTVSFEQLYPDGPPVVAAPEITEDGSEPK